jgi:hypothetical protein
MTGSLHVDIERVPNPLPAREKKKIEKEKSNQIQKLIFQIYTKNWNFGF